ncbi:hypothetical protein SAMN04489832_2529 [Micromonospora cremea]|uniref:Uncharacterized protein n=1 Tax=Micromonospora cremea TaxID=709881 RepID=A0A1N5WJP2_9ACTN|nr:hypothetical protein SAMN04489832_2529 [Micromonospora cremea]
MDPAIPLLPPAQPYEKVEAMYQALGREDTDLGRRALAHLRRERATEGIDDPR